MSVQVSKPAKLIGLCSVTFLLMANRCDGPGPVVRFVMPTQHNDNSRSGLTESKVTLNVSNVNSNRFRLLFTRSINDKIYAQPLYIKTVQFSNGRKNVVFVATAAN